MSMSSADQGFVGQALLLYSAIRIPRSAILLPWRAPCSFLILPFLPRMPLIQVRQSPVHGRGVFAARPIRKGRRIIEYTGRRVAWKSIPANVNGTHTFLFGI